MNTNEMKFMKISLFQAFIAVEKSFFESIDQLFAEKTTIQLQLPEVCNHGYNYMHVSVPPNCFLRFALALIHVIVSAYTCTCYSYCKPSFVCGIKILRFI